MIGTKLVILWKDYFKDMEIVNSYEEYVIFYTNRTMIY